MGSDINAQYAASAFAKTNQTIRFPRAKLPLSQAFAQYKTSLTLSEDLTKAGRVEWDAANTLLVYESGEPSVLPKNIN